MNSLFSDLKRAVVSLPFLCVVILQLLILQYGGFESELYHMSVPLVCTFPFSCAWHNESSQDLRRTGICQGAGTDLSLPLHRADFPSDARLFDNACRIDVSRESAARAVRHGARHRIQRLRAVSQSGYHLAVVSSVDLLCANMEADKAFTEQIFFLSIEKTCLICYNYFRCHERRMQNDRHSDYRR